MAFSRMNCTFYILYLEGSNWQFTGFGNTGIKQFPEYDGLIEISTRSSSPRHANLWVSDAAPSPPTYRQMRHSVPSVLNTRLMHNS